MKFSDEILLSYSQDFFFIQKVSYKPDVFVYSFIICDCCERKINQIKSNQTKPNQLAITVLNCCIGWLLAVDYRQL